MNSQSLALRIALEMRNLAFELKRKSTLQDRAADTLDSLATQLEGVEFEVTPDRAVGILAAIRREDDTWL